MPQVDACLELARTGHREGAFHCLIELGERALPRFVDAFRAEPDPSLRSLLVEVAWQLRAHASFAVLAEALRDPSPEVWRQALDGLVTLASAESVRILEAARDTVRVDDTDFQAWIEGAIEDVSGRVDE